MKYYLRKCLSYLAWLLYLDSNNRVATPDSTRTLTECELNDLIDYLETSGTGNTSEAHLKNNNSSSPSISGGQASSTQPSFQPPLPDKDDMKRAVNSHLPGSPVPKPRNSQRSSMKRSRSCDQLAPDSEQNEKKSLESHRRTAIIQGTEHDSISDKVRY